MMIIRQVALLRLAVRDRTLMPRPPRCGRSGVARPGGLFQAVRAWSNVSKRATRPCRNAVSRVVAGLPTLPHTADRSSPSTHSSVPTSAPESWSRETPS